MAGETDILFSLTLPNSVCHNPTLLDYIKKFFHRKIQIETF